MFLFLSINSWISELRRWKSEILKCHPVVKLAHIVHGPAAVVVPPVAVVRRHGHTVFPPASVGLAGQEVLAPLEVRDSSAVVEQVHALGAQVVDAEPHGPVPRVEEGLDVVGQGLLLFAVAGHRHPPAALQTLPGRSGVILIAVVDQVTFVSHPATFLTAWVETNKTTRVLSWGRFWLYGPPEVEPENTVDHVESG